MEPVAVAVEATAICGMDRTAVRLEEYSDLSFPFVYGSNFVGVVQQCDDDAEELGIKAGSRVASIVKWGSNSKCVSIPPDQLVVVPKHLDAGDLACLIACYLPAFEALHHGRARPYRYSRRCLKGRRVLITGGATVEAQALIRMAQLAGAAKIYVTAPVEHHLLIEKKQAGALFEDPDDWLQDVAGRMDIVIDYLFPRNFLSVCEALTDGGRLVSVPPGRTSILERCQLSTMERATLFDFGEYVAKYRDEIWEDFNFLLGLLEARQIRPQIDRYITLKDIPAVHKEMETSPLTGAVVCEPWKES